MITDEVGSIERRMLFVLSFQLEGFYVGALELVCRGVALGENTKTILRDLTTHAKKIGKGKVFELLPDLKNTDLADSDILIIASVLRSTIQAFLTPDEMSEQRKAFGLRPNGLP